MIAPSISVIQASSSWILISGPASSKIFLGPTSMIAAHLFRLLKVEEQVQTEH
jgi:hypothetical protein